MTITTGPEPSPAPAATTSERAVPVRANGVDLVGELQHSGYENPPYLVRRVDGQTLQLTDLLYVVLESIDGQRDLAAIADEVSDRIGRRASAEDVAFLVEEKLRPLGLLREPDGSEPAVEKANPLLALRFRVVLSDTRTTERITAPFRPLFAPPVVAAVVVAFVVMVGWLLFAEGLGAGTRELLYSPGMLLLTFALTALSAGFHEFGHAAACRYGGATPGAMGAGLYLVWPAFYTDVTDSYRLSRGGRLRTDLGGLYFNMIFALATFGAWAATGMDALLVLVPLQLMQMVQQLLPIVRLDGYYILADLTGVPDLFARIKPTLLSAVPGHDEDDRATALKPWVRVVVTTWVLVVIPLLLLSLVAAAVNLPRILATTWDSLGRQWDGVTAAFGDGDVLAVIAGVLGSVMVALPALSIVYLVSRLVTRTGRAGWRRTDGRPALRALLVVGASALAALLAWLWIPNGEYEPIRRGERWTVQDVASQVEELPSGRPGLTEARDERLADEAATDAGTADTDAPEDPTDADPTDEADTPPTTEPVSGSDGDEDESPTEGPTTTATTVDPDATTSTITTALEEPSP